MPVISTERARWLAAHVLPLEPQLRGWLKRVTPSGLEVDDLIQEAYAKLVALTSVSNITQPKAYVYQIVKRLLSAHAASSPRGYEKGEQYLVGNVARRTSRAIAVSYRLREVTSWPIEVLSVVCIVYQLPTDTDVDPEGLRAALARDSRVQSVQPLVEFAVDHEF